MERLKLLGEISPSLGLALFLLLSIKPTDIMTTYRRQGVGGKLAVGSQSMCGWPRPAVRVFVGR